jgi:hypothetical protein
VRISLRPTYPVAKLDEIYPKPFDHTKWDAHKERIDFTYEFVIKHLSTYLVNSIADLACGDGALARRLRNTYNAKRLHLGDLVSDEFRTGPIEKTILQIEPVDLFILTETLEHLENPDYVLAAVRQETSYLVLSTPLGETDDRNPEHYWGWDQEGIREMLTAAGFAVYAYEEFTPKSDDYYTFQNWICA